MTTRRVRLQVPLNADHTLSVIQGDLTQEPAEAIVNAANAYLQHGGGLAGAIVQRGGPSIQHESDAWVRAHGPLTHDRAAVTRAGALPARYILHVVGPVWGSGDEAAKLRAATQAALRAAQDLGVHSLALPAISTGIFGYPVDEAATVIVNAIYDAVARGMIPDVKDVRLVLYDAATAQTFEQAVRARHAPR